MLQAATVLPGAALDPRIVQAERAGSLALAEVNKAAAAGHDLGKALSGADRAAQVAAAHALIDAVGDGSNLLLDPDLDSFYVMDAAVVRLPEMLELNWRLLGQARAQAERTDISKAEYAATLIDLGKVRANLDGVERSLAKAFAANAETRSRRSPGRWTPSRAPIRPCSRRPTP